MSTEDRILRLENAMSMLVEFAAEQQRLAAEQQRLAAEQQRRTARLEESFTLLVELARVHGERVDEVRGDADELRTAQAESERKISALIDAQIKTEDAVRRLAETQTQSDKKLEALIDLIRERQKGQG